MRNLFLLTILIIALFVGCSDSEVNKPEQVVRNYFEKAIKGNLDEANALFSKQSSSYTKEKKYNRINGYNKYVNDNDKFVLKIVSHPKWENDKNFKYFDVFVTNDTAKTDYMKSYKKGRDGEDVSNVRFEIIKENGNWKIKL